MLYSTTAPQDKRLALRSALASDRIVRLPGIVNPASAGLIQRHGFEGVYVSGSVIAADMGLPDIGLTTLTEVANRARQVARTTDLPALVDADTGFGEPMNLARTIQELEDAGVAGCHVEDQVNPKRCGHLDGKQVVDTATAARRIRSAVEARRDPNFLIMARTDVRGVDGLDAMIERAKALVDAGADALFPEALRSLDEYEKVSSAVDVPILANMTEFGKTDLFTVDQLSDAGVSMVIWPVSLLRLALGVADRALAMLASQGTLKPVVDQMQTREQLYELLDYSGYAAFDGDVFNFTVSSTATPED